MIGMRSPWRPLPAPAAAAPPPPACRPPRDPFPPFPARPPLPALAPARASRRGGKGRLLPAASEGRRDRTPHAARILHRTSLLGFGAQAGFAFRPHAARLWPISLRMPRRACLAFDATGSGPRFCPRRPFCAAPPSIFRSGAGRLLRLRRLRVLRRNPGKAFMAAARTARARLRSPALSFWPVPPRRGRGPAARGACKPSPPLLQAPRAAGAWHSLTCRPSSKTGPS